MHVGSRMPSAGASSSGGRITAGYLGKAESASKKDVAGGYAAGSGQASIAVEPPSCPTLPLAMTPAATAVLLGGVSPDAIAVLPRVVVPGAAAVLPVSVAPDAATVLPQAGEVDPGEVGSLASAGFKGNIEEVSLGRVGTMPDACATASMLGDLKGRPVHAQQGTQHAVKTAGVRALAFLLWACMLVRGMGLGRGTGRRGAATGAHMGSSGQALKVQGLAAAYTVIGNMGWLFVGPLPAGLDGPKGVGRVQPTCTAGDRECSPARWAAGMCLANGEEFWLGDPDDFEISSQPRHIG